MCERDDQTSAVPPEHEANATMRSGERPTTEAIAEEQVVRWLHEPLKPSTPSPTTPSPPMLAADATLPTDPTADTFPPPRLSVNFGEPVESVNFGELPVEHRWPLPEQENSACEPLQLVGPGRPTVGSSSLKRRSTSPVSLAAARESLGSKVAAPPHSQTVHLITSTLLSLAMVIVLLLMARWLVPSLVESTRYAWYRGQLRAEYELSGQRLKNVSGGSVDSLADVSRLVSRRVKPSVVHVNLLRPNMDEQQIAVYERTFGATHPLVRYDGQGSGFVIDDRGYILTNNHVVEGVGQIEVTLADGRQLPATVIGSDPPTDLAVIKVEANGLLPVEWGDSDEVVVGTPVWAAGSPFGLQQTFTFGIISGKHRIDLRGTRYERGILSGNAYGDLMQSDVALNPGNSGGPLVDMYGDVIGVNAAILGETYHGVSFSIPSKVARRVASHLMNGSDVPRGWLGISMEDLGFDERYDRDGTAIPGVRVMGFPRDGRSPAREAGIEVNDVIVAFDRQPVMNRVELMRIIGDTEVGAQCTVTVLREGAELDFMVKVAKRQIGL